MCGRHYVVLALLTACGSVEVSPVDSARSAIVGGSAAPSAASVFLLYDTSNSRAFCSATLIGTRTLLTAAHCLDAQVTGVATGAVAASNAPSLPEVNTSTRYTLVETASAPMWNPVTLKRDLALALLDRAPPDVAPLPWNRASLAGLEGAPLRAFGFGAAVPGGTGDDLRGTRRVVDLTIRQLADDTLRLGDLDAHGVCYGDSGGPSLHTFGDGIERVVGVHSSTADSACVDGTDTRVDAVVAFIDQWMSAKEPATCAADNRCLPGCTPVDVDCFCASDGVCGPDCGDRGTDPDCHPDGTPCATGLTCLNAACVNDPQHQPLYCSRPCVAGSACADGMVCDVSAGVCRYRQLPVGHRGDDCVSGEVWCAGGDVCAGRNAPWRCSRTCGTSRDCVSPSLCETGSDGQRFCTTPSISKPRATFEGPAEKTCASAGLGAVWPALLAVALVRRKRFPLSRARG